MKNIFLARTALDGPVLRAVNGSGRVDWVRVDTGSMVAWPSHTHPWVNITRWARADIMRRGRADFSRWSGLTALNGLELAALDRLVLNILDAPGLSSLDWAEIKAYCTMCNRIDFTIWIT